MGYTVLIADDHQMLVEGVRQTLDDAGFEVVGVAHTTEGLVEKYFELRPDVFVVDIRFEHSGFAKTGLDICFELLSQDADAKVVVYSQFDSPFIVQETYNQGAKCFVRKDEMPDIIVAAVTAAAEGHRYYPPETAKILGVQPGLAIN